MPEYATNDDLPPPTPELVLLRVVIEAQIATMGRKRAETFLALVAEKLAGEENIARVFAIRPNGMEAEVRRARRQAAAVFERYMPTFLARLPRG